MVEKYAQDMGERQKRLFNDFVKICIYATDVLRKSLDRTPSVRS